jgi:hypothetical protein
MRQLIDYINEGILGNTDDVLAAGDVYVTVEKWLKEHYNVSRCTYDIVTTKNGCVVNVNGDIRMRVPMRGEPDHTALTNGMFRFGTVNGDFDANYQDLKNLEGSPRVVTGKFTVDSNDCEFTCEGGPDEVYGIRLGSNCVSLEGMPQKTHFIVCKNSKLTSLKGCGKAYVYNFSESDMLESLEGIPACKCSITLNGCKKLKNLKGLEKTTLTEIRLESCKGLKSLEGMPTKFANTDVGDKLALLDLTNTNLKSLKGIPSNADLSNVNVTISGCDALEDISMLPKCAKLEAFYLPKLSKECYDNINDYANEVSTGEFPMKKAKKSILNGFVYLRG